MSLSPCGGSSPSVSMSGAALGIWTGVVSGAGQVTSFFFLLSGRTGLISLQPVQAGLGAPGIY